VTVSANAPSYLKNVELRVSLFEVFIAISISRLAVFLSHWERNRHARSQSSNSPRTAPRQQNEVRQVVLEDSKSKLNNCTIHIHTHIHSSTPTLTCVRVLTAAVNIFLCLDLVAAVINRLWLFLDFTFTFQVVQCAAWHSMSTHFHCYLDHSVISWNEKFEIMIAKTPYQVGNDQVRVFHQEELTLTLMIWKSLELLVRRTHFIFTQFASPFNSFQPINVVSS
jgi:hypothetical protein